MKKQLSSILTFAIVVGLFTAPALADHRFIANQNRKLCRFDADGKLEWSMEIGGSPHDLHQLPSGNILTHQNTELIEIDPKSKQIVWKFDAKKLCKKKKVEVHALQPIENDRIMVAVSGEGKIFEIDRDGTVQFELQLKIDHPHPHRDTRLVRRLDDGQYLVAQEGDGFVRQYGRDGKVTWEYDVPMFGRDATKGHGPEAFGDAVFSAIRLPNGNTLIGTGNGHSILEVTPEKEVVWKVTQNDLPGITLAWVTTLEIHENGNIILGNCHAGPDHPQLIEIDREKNVIWKFKDFENLGNAVSNSQIIDAKGKVLR
ncbi:PQQ-binding-like beta-propeller repeat protein [Planctomycetes bacterium K23_9]|uniref:Arylsulfotransferase (ASST) n=1 Tax=Stieleria marina TaxID=1930275 RepID=A0A517NXA6_9BACT|nr:Arylsulfotransferase (ASST) [Planctomycetes bacterium K23_9]